MARFVVRFRVRSAAHARGYRLRPVSFLVSALLHGAFIGAALLAPLPSERGAEARRPIYDTYIRPEQKRIVWYRFPKTLPQVSGAKAPYAPRPQGENRSPQTIIAASDRATNSKQLIWRPDRPPSIAAEIESPNLIALAPSVPTPKRKEFTAPPGRQGPATPAPEPVQLDAPNLEVGTAAANAPILKARQFVAPPPKVREPEPAPAVPAPNVSINGRADERGANLMRQLRAAAPPLPSKLTVPASGSSGSAPNLAAGTQGRPAGASSGTAGAQPGATAAVVGMNPSDRTRSPLPEGTRPGQFSTAPTVGSPGVPGAGGGIHVPGLRVEGAPGSAGSPRGSATTLTGTPAGKPVLYTETIAGPLPSTFSAPLHPSSRSLPGSIESRFHDRTVYVLVIPAPVLPEYSGDWTLWFAERASGTGTSRIRAPLPYRRIQPSGSTVERKKAGRHVVVSFIIGKNGAVQPLDTGTVPEQAIEDLRSWEFRPAMRNGVPVDVEAVLDFVFRDGG